MLWRWSQTDEAKNMINQITGREANESLNGGKTKFITTIEDPIVSIHGNVAVASFVRWWNVYPNGKTPNQSAPTWVTLVLVKDQSDWLISHTHQSPVGGNQINMFFSPKMTQVCSDFTEYQKIARLLKPRTPFSADS